MHHQPVTSPRQILETLLPYLRTAGAYAQQIQAQIAEQPAKDFDPENFFATALSDADLSVQTFIEVALLAHFPTIRFFGEEYAQTYNTKYFRAIDLGPAGDYLITLDPIDGTKFYLDGHDNYMVILTVCNADEYEAAIAMTPGQHCYYYALRGQGAYRGSWTDSLEACQLLRVNDPTPAICLGFSLNHLVDHIPDRYTLYPVKTAYSKENRIPNFNGLLSGELTGAVMARGQFIDGAALAFMAQEMGHIVTTWDGTAPPPLHTSSDMRRPGLVIGSSPEVHGDLLAAVQAVS
ncbi:inositol-1-monophosphatase [filamentous cyanobacterium CCP5]|nr:inositol-1-monophosphatase [filamentous cyanobacterium CCP5]